MSSPSVTATSYRDVFLLACCQALLLTNAAGLISMTALVGYALADAKSLTASLATAVDKVKAGAVCVIDVHVAPEYARALSSALLRHIPDAH